MYNLVFCPFDGSASIPVHSFRTYADASAMAAKYNALQFLDIPDELTNAECAAFGVFGNFGVYISK